jgi:regulator of nucleoside diphosphate kinase
MPRVTKAATKARRRRESASRREVVLRAAEAVFQAGGYQAATADRIAESAGISVGTAYNIFGSKDRIYASVVEQIAEEMLAFIQENILPLEDPEGAIERLIAFRLSNFGRHRLFLVLFSCERTSGAYPDADAVSRKIKDLYYRYLDLVAMILDRSMREDVFDTMHSLHLALSFEGVLGAFVGYWSAPGGQNEPPESRVRHVKESFLRMIGLRRSAAAPPVGNGTGLHRGIYITRFDFVRLKELIAVARGFGGSEGSAHLDDLESGLGRGRIVDPTLVPRDVVTMNSRFRLTGPSGTDASVCCLVFPADAGRETENLSVLDPLGTALLGRRAGDLVEVPEPGGVRQYRIAEILYQPESAGDYHR